MGYIGLIRFPGKMKKIEGQTINVRHPRMGLSVVQHIEQMVSSGIPNFIYQVRDNL